MDQVSLDDSLLETLILQNKLERSLERIYSFLEKLDTGKEEFTRPTGVLDIGLGKHWVHLHHEYWGVIAPREEGKWHLEMMLPIYTPLITYSRHALWRLAQRGMIHNLAWIEQEFLQAYERGSLSAKPPAWASAVRNPKRSNEGHRYLRTVFENQHQVGVFAPRKGGKRWMLLTWIVRTAEPGNSGTKRDKKPRPKH